MEDISVIFTVTRFHFQFIDYVGDFKLSEPVRAFCDTSGDVIGDFHNTPLLHKPDYNLYDPNDNTSLRTLAEAAKKLGCTKAMFHSNKIITDRSFALDRGKSLDFYKCYFYFESDSTSQILSEYFISMSNL